MTAKVALILAAVGVVVLVLVRRASAAPAPTQAPYGGPPSRTVVTGVSGQTGLSVAPSATQGWFQPCPAGFHVNWSDGACYPEDANGIPIVDVSKVPPPPPPNEAELAANPEVRSGLGHF